MNRQSATSWLKQLPLRLLLTSAMLLTACQAIGQSPVIGQQDSAVLLNNDNVLTGRVSLVAGQYRVRNEGSELRLRPSDVAHVAESPAALYQWKAAALPSPGSSDRLALAEWCIRNRLFPEAAKELLLCKAQTPNSEQRLILEQRLEQAWRGATETKSKHGDARTAILDKQFKSQAEAAAQARLAKSLPDGSLEEFTRRVQPILVNNCTSSGCHATGGPQRFQLNRDLLHGHGGRRSTFANLRATLAAINRENVSSSPLLNAAQGPHAGNPTGILTGPRAALLDRVAAWAHYTSDPGPTQATPRNTVAASAGHGFASLVGGSFSASRASHQLAIATPQETKDTAEPAVRPADYQESAANRHAAVLATFEEVGNAASDKLLPQDSAPRELSAQAGWVDEFDPAIFNRRYHKTAENSREE